MNALANKNVFSCVLNAAGESALRIVCSNEFQIFGAEHEKRRAAVLVRDCGSTRRLWSVKRSVLVGGNSSPSTPETLVRHPITPAG